MARAVDVPLSIDDFQNGQQSRAVPGRSQAERQIGAGRPAQGRRHAGRDEVPAGKRTARRRLPDRHRPHAGREPREICPACQAGQTIVQPIENPIKATGHIQILRGNLAPDGAVAKITGKEGMRFSGPAKVYDSEEDMLPRSSARKSSKATWW